MAKKVSMTDAEYELRLLSADSVGAACGFNRAAGILRQEAGAAFVGGQDDALASRLRALAIRFDALEKDARTKQAQYNREADDESKSGAPQ